MLEVGIGGDENLIDVLADVLGGERALVEMTYPIKSFPKLHDRLDGISSVTRSLDIEGKPSIHCDDIPLGPKSTTE